jgi:hypothetical protein
MKNKYLLVATLLFTTLLSLAPIMYASSPLVEAGAVQCPDGTLVPENTPCSTRPQSNSTSTNDGSAELSGDCNPEQGPDGVAPELNSENCGIVGYMVIAINLLSALAGMAIVFSIMFAGYQYMTARDNAGQIQQARQRIIWAISALLIFIFSYALLNFLVPGGIL